MKLYIREDTLAVFSIFLGRQGLSVDYILSVFPSFLKKKTRYNIGVLKLKYLSLYLQFGGKEMALAGFHCQLWESFVKEQKQPSQIEMCCCWPSTSSSKKTFPGSHLPVHRYRRQCKSSRWEKNGRMMPLSQELLRNTLGGRCIKAPETVEFFQFSKRYWQIKLL